MVAYKNLYFNFLKYIFTISFKNMLGAIDPIGLIPTGYQVCGA